jgi:hypothetical protein
LLGGDALRREKKAQAGGWKGGIVVTGLDLPKPMILVDQIGKSSYSCPEGKNLS